MTDLAMLSREIELLRADLQRARHDAVTGRFKLPHAFMSIDEVADHLRISRRTIDRRRKAGTWKIPEYDFEGRIAYRTTDVEEYCKGRLVGKWGDD